MLAFTLFVLIGISCHTSFAVIIQPEQPTELNISSLLQSLELHNIPTRTSMVQFQVHTHLHNLTLSLDEEIKESRYTNGSHIGVLAELSAGSTTSTVYVRCASCQNGENATVIAMSTQIGDTEPVPGACSTEFPMENDPNIIIPKQRFVNRVQFQYANLGKGRLKPWLSCENPASQSLLTYSMYQLFFRAVESSEGHFLEHMYTVLNRTEFLKQAKKVDMLEFGKGKPQVDFASYYGQGVAYVITVNQKSTNSVSAYVPVIVYNCEFTKDGNCNMRTAGIVSSQVTGTLLAVAGVVLCFVGHRLFKTSMFLFGFLAFTILFLTILLRFSTWSLMAATLTSLACGVVGGLLWLTVWGFLGMPVLSVLIPGLVLGYLLASIVFVTTPLDDLTTLETSFNYGMCFMCAILVPVVILLAFSRVLHIFSCATVGSFLVVFAFDLYLHGNIQRIITTSIKKSASDEFLLINNTWPPFTASDIILSIVWILLWLGGCFFQYRRERRRPQFPPCPYQEYKLRHAYHPLSGLDTGSPEGDEEQRDRDREREPLLHPSHRVSRGEHDPFDSDQPGSSSHRGGLLSSRSYEAVRERDSPRSPADRRQNQLTQNVAGFYEDRSEGRRIIDPI